jgi:hypothetical protein
LRGERRAAWREMEDVVVYEEAGLMAVPEPTWRLRGMGKVRI